ncbi:MAG TPA: acid-CoA ligase, partial [Bacillota bacterium]
LYARSAMTASGYLGEDGELVPLADGDGWVTAGDVAYRGADGLIYLIGRSDDAINSGGVKIYPAEIERVLAEHPAVDQAVVLGWPDRRRGEAVIAAVVARAGTSVTAAELRAFCAARLAPGRRPQRILLLPELPRTAGGKVAREALRQLLQRLLA